jgi:YegS/Rv2252/BmrU family lipid kinase
LKALFLINTKSGRKRGYDIEELIRSHCTLDFAIQQCSRKEDLDGIIAGAAQNGFDAVFAVGGDGTVHETAKRLVGTPLALGILPIGSGNGFARHLGVPIEPRASLASQGASRILTIDTAQVNDDRFLGVMGVGFDAFMADRFAMKAGRGLRTYVRVGIEGFAGYRAEEYEIEVDGKKMSRAAFVIAIANGSQYGNNARIAPLASVQDGLLDLVIIDDVSLLRAPFLMVRLFNGTIHRARGITSMQGREITIRRVAAGPVHLDGEPLTMGETLTIRVVPESLKVVVPEGTVRI